MLIRICVIYQVSILLTVAASAQNQFTIPLSKGTVFYYFSQTTQSTQKRFIRKEIVDTAYHGFIKFDVKYYYGVSTPYPGEEYWYYKGGRFYTGPYRDSVYNLRYISTLTKDSSASNGNWRKEKCTFFGKVYDSQICSVYTYMGRNGAHIEKYRTTNELGLTEIYDAQTGGGAFPNTTLLVGILKDHVLIGDSVNMFVTGLAPLELPVQFMLEQNYPNPFNPSTTISFSLPSQTRVKLAVYDVLGKIVATLIDGDAAAGTHRAVWNGCTSHGLPAASGVYVYRLESDGMTHARTMLLMK